MSVDQLEAQPRRASSLKRQICYQAGNRLVLVTADHDQLNFFVYNPLHLLQKNWFRERGNPQQSEISAASRI